MGLTGISYLGINQLQIKTNPIILKLEKIRTYIEV